MSPTARQHHERRWQILGIIGIAQLMVDRLGTLVTLAEECLEEPDPWIGLTSFFERSLGMQVADRGLKDVLFSQGRGRPRVVEARRHLAPVVSQLVRRAVDAGVVRADLATTDVPLINMMVNAIVDFGTDVEPELYRRYLGIVFDGLRARRDDATPLPVDALPVRRLQQTLAGDEA